MDTDKFVISDADGIPEGIKDPLDILIPEKDPVPKPAPRNKRPAMPNFSKSPKVTDAPKEIKQDPTPPRRPGRPSKSDLQKEVEKELEAMLLLGSSFWAMRDEECAPVLSAQAGAISESLAAILAKNPKLLERMRDMTGMGDYMKLAMAIMPVIAVVRDHHITPAIAKREHNA